MYTPLSYRKVRHGRADYYGEKRFCVCTPNDSVKETEICTANRRRVTCPACIRILNELDIAKFKEKNP